MTLSSETVQDEVAQEMVARSVRVTEAQEEIPRLFLAVTVLVYMFLLAPIVVVVLAGLNAGSFLTFPPEGLSLRWVHAFLASPVYVGAYLFSLRLAVIAGLISTVLGTMTALVVTRYEFPGRGLLNALFLSPIMLPGVVIGLALYVYYASTFTPLLKTFWGLLLGHMIVTVPYVLRAVSASLYNFDLTLEEAARNLGAGPIRAFFKVTLPIIRPGILAGTIFSFIVSFGQFDVSLFLYVPDLMPLPIALYEEMRFRYTPIVAAAGGFTIAMVAIIMFFTSRVTDLRRFAVFK